MRKKIVLNCVGFVSILLLATSGHLIHGQKSLPKVLQNNSTLSPVGEYETAATTYKSSRTQEGRNKLIFMAISQIDLAFQNNVKKNRHRNVFFQTVLDILEVGAATAISISNGERGKSVIADALGFLQGSRAKANKNLRLLEQQVIVNKMIEKRSIVLTSIYSKINESDAQYPFERAFIDVLDYYQAGTTDGALSALATDSGTSATNAQTQLALAKQNANIVIAPTAAQIKISRENSDFVQGFIDSYKAEEAKIAAATAAANAAQALIDAENAKVPPAVPDAAAIAAQTAIKAAEMAKKPVAEAAQKAAFDKLKAIFKSIEQDSVLAPFLDKLPEKYPGLADSIRQQLNRIRVAKTGTIDDYGSIILKFFALVKDAANDNPTVVDRAKNIVDSVK